MLQDLSLTAPSVLPLLFSAALKGAVALTLGLAAVALLRRRAASVRHAVLATALAAAAVLPLLLLSVPAWEVGILPGKAASEVSELPTSVNGVDATPAKHSASTAMRVDDTNRGGLVSTLGRGSEVLPAVSEGLGGVTALAARAHGWIPQTLRSLPIWLVLIYLSGVILVAGRWLGAYWSARALVEDAHPADSAWRKAASRTASKLGIVRHVDLRVSNRLAVPVAWCYLRPAVVLPADAEEWSDERRDLVLLHEFAHIARWDGATQLIAQMAVALHWFNPLAWLSYRQLLAEREQACDDIVLAAQVRPTAYAEHLVAIARRYRQDSLALAAVAAMARGPELSDRIKAILAPDVRRARLSRGVPVILGAAGALLLLPLAAFTPVTTQSEGGTSFVASLLPSGAGTADPDWTWEGRARAGDVVEVYGLNGAVNVREGSGSRVRVVGTPRGRNARNARLVVNDVRNGVVICVVYPGQSGCEPGKGTSGRARNTNNASVALDVEIPARVQLKARTTNGSIRAEPLSAAVEVRSTNGSVRAASRTGDVRAHTTNGSINVSAAGRLEARTTNGSITAQLASTDWRGASVLSTTNGAVRVELPRNASVEVDARTRSGAISSAFDGVRVERQRGAGATAAGTIGRGGRQLEIRTTNGAITLVSAGGRTSHAVPPQGTRDAWVDDPATAGASVAAELALSLDELDDFITHELDLQLGDLTGELASLSTEIGAVTSAAVSEALAAVNIAALVGDVLSAVGAELSSEQARGRLHGDLPDAEELRREIDKAMEEVRRALAAE